MKIKEIENKLKSEKFNKKIIKLFNKYIFTKNEFSFNISVTKFAVDILKVSAINKSNLNIRLPDFFAIVSSSDSHDIIEKNIIKQFKTIVKIYYLNSNNY